MRDALAIDFAAVERPYRERSSGGQMRIIFNQIITNARLRARSLDHNEVEYDSLLRDAYRIVSSLKDSLKSNIDAARDEKFFWIEPSMYCFTEGRPESWREISPFNLERVKDHIDLYLEHKFMQSNFIDLSLINALLFNEAIIMFHTHMDKYSGLPKIISDSLKGSTIKKTTLSFLVKLVIWIFLPYSIYSDFTKSNYGESGIILSIWIFLVVRRVLKNRRKEDDIKLTQKAVNAWIFSNGGTTNPSRLKSILLSIEDERGCYPSQLHTLLDRAIARDPTHLSASN